MKHQSLPNQTHRNQFFQFLWGWNISCMKLNIWSLYSAAFQFLWGWNHNGENMSRRSIQLSIPLRMKPMWSRSTGLPPPQLSIPLRMKQVCQCHGIPVYPYLCFQFLWGWNSSQSAGGILRDILSIPLRMKHTRRRCGPPSGLTDLSIPLRMKRTPQLLRTWRGWSFNSFEDETIIATSSPVSSPYFQFLWGWNKVS